MKTQEKALFSKPLRMSSCLGILLLLTTAARGQLVLSDDGYETNALTGTTVTMTGHSELHLTGSSTPLSGCTIHLNSTDSWVFMHEIAPSTVISSYLGQFRVDNASAVNNTNIKVVQHGQGAVIIPYPAGFQPMEVFEGENFSGSSQLLSPNTAYGSVLNGKVSSFILKRGYMATLAVNAGGTGVSINYVASEGDLKVGALPAALNDHVRFIRVYPWHWVAKKGSCDVSPVELDAQWYYNWNVTSQPANPNYEYVAIKQQRWWPGLPNPGDAGYLGVNHVSGYNEPNNPVEDAYTSLNNGDVATAVGAWGELEGTGLRIGAPAVTDGGYGWITDFIAQAEAAGRRVDYVPIHYYQAYWNNDDPAGAAGQLYNFLKGIYDATHKPIWLTEFNNGANWTNDAYDPNVTQNRNVIEAMIDMMDDVPWIERYSVYSRVEWFRQTHYDGGGYTPMGSMYRDHGSPISYQQIIPGEGRNPSASYYFEGTLDDASGSGNHAVSKNYPNFVPGHGGGSSIQFDGVDDHVILPDSLSDSTDFTFAAWVYWNGGAAWQRIFDFGIMDSSEYMFLTPTTGSALRFAITTSGWGGEQRLTAASPLPANDWTHVAVTISGNTGRLYVNGAQVDINTSMTLNPTSLGAIQHYLGRSQFPADPYFSGKIDDVVIRNTALSPTQISALMNSQPPVPPTNVVVEAAAYENVPYTGSVAGAVTDPDGTAITYSRLYGPSWLNVGTDGTLSGTPSGSLDADQYFTIRATDTAGESAYFILNLNYVDIPDDFTAGPIAHWDFNDPALGAASGAALPDSDGYAVWREAAADKSGNGNHLTTWDYDWAGFTWSTTSTEGDFSMIAAGTYPAAFTWSDESSPVGYNVETVVLSNFTVEAMVTTSGSGFRTAVGRDARYVTSEATDHAAFYLGLNPENHPRVIMVDEFGTLVEVVATGVTVPNNSATWYHLAAVKKNNTLSLYVNGSLAASTTSPGLGAMAVDSSGGDGWHGGGWSVGRGLWAGGHTDRWYGHIDAVAISGVALAPGSFVITGTWPEPYAFYFDDHGIPGAPFEGDANSNGVPNGMEYYLGWDPAAPVTTNEVLAFSSDYLSVIHPYNPSASGVYGAVEWTSDLMSSNWYTSGITYVTNEPAAEIEAMLGTSTTNKIFLRLRVTD